MLCKSIQIIKFIKLILNLDPKLIKPIYKSIYIIKPFYKSI